LRIAVYEHFSAMGAFYSPAWIEGDAMLKAVVEDLRRAGHEVQVADSIPPKRPADLVVVIAPSTGRTLYNLVKSCEEEGLDVVDSPSTAVFVATDKALLYKNLEAHGVRTPKTLISRYEEGLKAIERALAAFGKVVVKPADGNGCAGLSIVSRPEEAPIALSNAKQSSRLPYFLAQEYVEGENLSVCLLASDDAVVPLSINVQRVHLKGPREPSMYTGSVVPYQDSEEVLRAALRAVKSLGHVKGFFGVDLVLKGGEPYIVEVNPRFTTSYLALREVCEDNVPDLMVRSYFDKSSLRPVKLRGKAIVGKLIADRDMALNSRDLKPPGNAKVLSLITDKRYFVKKGEAYALYVVKEL
jgi:predicted ATP-grasp superfamily ATP-dependent carboligase